jgi:hypothetical protein
MNRLLRLANAARATRERFEGMPFDWRTTATCIHMVRFHARKAGHRLPKVPRIRSALAAKRVLDEMGHDNLCSLLDAHFERIAPAEMVIGDVMALPGDSAFEALVIRTSPTKFLGWHEDAAGCCQQEPDISAALGAWRL